MIEYRDELTNERIRTTFVGLGYTKTYRSYSLNLGLISYMLWLMLYCLKLGSVVFFTSVATYFYWLIDHSSSDEANRNQRQYSVAIWAFALGVNFYQCIVYDWA